MKFVILILALFSTQAFAQDPWTETYKLPEGTTYRARAAGYDCGTFGAEYVEAPEIFKSKGIEFKQLSADKDLNHFLFEAAYPGLNGEACIYGIFFDRNRDDKTLDFSHSLVQVKEGSDEGCMQTKEFIDQQLLKVAYEASKRGLRYIAAEVIKGANNVCDTGSARVVFDRR